MTSAEKISPLAKPRGPRKKSQSKYKITVTMKMDLKGDYSYTSTKGPNKLVSEEEAMEFLRDAHTYLYGLEDHWKECYKKPKNQKILDIAEREETENGSV